MDQREVQRETGHRGQPHVEQGRVGVLGAQQVVRGLGARGAEHAMSLASDRALEDPSERGLVLDDQHGERMGAHDAVACARRTGRKPCATRSSASAGSRVSRISPAVRPR